MRWAKLRRISFSSALMMKAFLACTEGSCTSSTLRNTNLVIVSSAGKEVPTIQSISM